MEFTGIITFIGEIETVGQNGLQKRSFVLEEVSDKEWKQSLCIDLIKDKVSLLNKLSKGDKVTAHLNYTARYSEKAGKHFNSVNARRLDVDKSQKMESTDDDMPF